jgi:hypothetical protein
LEDIDNVVARRTEQPDAGRPLEVDEGLLIERYAAIGSMTRPMR